MEIKINRRVDKEIKSFWLSNDLSKNKLLKSTIYLDSDVSERTVFFRSIIQNYELLIRIKFLQEYPFRPPLVWVNNYDYRDLLVIKGNIIQKFIGNKCSCCSTILCNWCVSYGTREIISEIRQMLIIKLKLNEIRLIRQLVRQKIGTYVPIEEFI